MLLIKKFPSLSKGSFTLAKIVAENDQLFRAKKMPALLALATLGDPTQIGLVLFCVVSTKVAKASTVMTFLTNFANVNRV